MTLGAVQWHEYLLDLGGKVLIPLIIGWVSYKIARRQISNSGVTQFRQKWIDNVRDAISVFIAKAEVISMLDYDEDEAYFEHFKELSQMQHKIELFLNPQEEDHNEIVELLNDIREIIHEETIDEKLEDKMYDKIQKLLNVSKRVLKREWNVVKKGA